MKQSGIYKITSKTSNHFYIGSAINIKERWRRHKKDLRKGKHHSIILQRAWEKYKEEDFIFEILELCNVDSLIIREQYYMNELLPIYNISPTAGSQKGRIEREETKIKRRIHALANGIRPPESTWKDKQKAVVKLDDERNKIERFDSLAAACRSIGRDHTFVTCITRAIKLNVKSYNYYWKYEE